MPRPAHFRVFISYARKDGAQLAQRLQQDLSTEGFDAWLDTRRITGGASWTLEIEQALDRCQVALALLTRGSYASEICRAEQLRALRKGKRVIPLLAQSGADIPLHLESKNYRDFTSASSYAPSFQKLLADIRGRAAVKLKEAYRVTRLTYVTAPARVANYLERPAALRALRDVLFAEDSRQPIALTALVGMGGLGKTVLAKALTEDEVIQQAFPDGIVWITAGRESARDFVQQMREVAKALGDDLARYDTAAACEHQYRTTIANKAALIILDNVWSKADLEPLLAESPRSRFLFTTRDVSIAHFVGARVHTAQLMDEAQSRELLAAWAGLAAEQLPHQAGDVIVECGRLPGAISMMGGLLRDVSEEEWNDWLIRLRNADLAAIEAQLPPGQESFFKVVEVSVKALAPEMQEHYRALAVLLEDMPAPIPILTALWNVDEADARRISKLLADRSLAQRDGESAAIRLHDLQLDYIRAQYPDRKALDLIHGAVRLSSHVIERDPWQFASQMVGRLIPHQMQPTVQRFTASLTNSARRPWIRPLQPALDPPGTGLLRTLAGHSDSVAGVAVSADGRRAVSASWDQTLKLWDLESGRELRTLAGHSNSIRGVAVSSDGWQAVSACDDQTLKVWDLESGRELRTLAGHSSYVSGVAMSSNGRRVVSASSDHTLKVWDLESGRELRTLVGHSLDVFGVAVSADGKRAVSASRDQTLKVWDLESGLELHTLAGHSADVSGVAMSADGQRAVSASDDQTLKVWDLDSGRELRTLVGHSGWVSGVAMSADGRLAVSASMDNTLKVWELDSGRELRTLAGHSDSVSGVAMSADGRRVVSASRDKTLKVWDLETGRDLPTLAAHSGSVAGVAVSADGRRVVSASADKTLKVLDLETGNELRTLDRHSASVWDVAVSADGRQAVSASVDKTLKVWDLETGREVCTLSGHTASVYCVAMSADGRRAASGSGDHTLKVWDLETGNELRALVGHSGWIYGVAVSADWRRAVSASADRTLKVWDLDTGRELRTLAGHSDYVSGVALSPDGRQAVSASGDHALKAWDLETGRELRTLAGHSSYVTGVATSPDGRRAVSTSGDHTLKVWDLETGELVATFTCDAPPVCSKFAGLRTIIAGDQSGRVHFLSLEL